MVYSGLLLKLTICSPNDGSAGRPQFDDQGVAVILVHDVKKHFYKKFLYEPFPVESNLLEVMADHLNAEVVSGTISSKQDAMDYITWTYFFRRLLRNPSDNSCDAWRYTYPRLEAE
ncbi:activating signal cointegrator 1 complex subunit [Bulinus truncatus]|nr:activating signal cointegrator 1 complex subunit [Bulinus truncatus]